MADDRWVISKASGKEPPLEKGDVFYTRLSKDIDDKGNKTYYIRLKDTKEVTRLLKQLTKYGWPVTFSPEAGTEKRDLEMVIQDEAK